MQRPPVERLLRAHQPADPDETADHQTILRIFAETDPTVDLFDKTTVAPGHVTASALVTDPRRTHVLLIHHPALGLWIQPGGHTDPSDADPAAAAARELREETGLEAPAARCLGLLDVAVHAVPDGIKGQPAHLHLDLRFAFEASRDAPLAGEAHTPAAWVPLDTLATHHTDDSVRAAARRLQHLPR